MSSGELTLIALASLVGVFVKSVTGMGYPMLAVPFLSLFIGVHDAVVIIALPNTITNLVINRASRAARHETRDLGILASTIAVGSVIGVILLVRLPETPLILALVATVVIFVIRYFRSPRTPISQSTTHRWAPPVGVLAGVMQGAVGISGPILAMWLHGYQLGKDAYVYSVTWLFFIGGSAQLAVLLLSGEFTVDRVVASGVALAVALAVVPIGSRLRGRIAGDVFEKLVVVLLSISAISLTLRLVT